MGTKNEICAFRFHYFCTILYLKKELKNFFFTFSRFHQVPGLHQELTLECGYLTPSGNQILFFSSSFFLRASVCALISSACTSSWSCSSSHSLSLSHSLSVLSSWSSTGLRRLPFRCSGPFLFAYGYDVISMGFVGSLMALTHSLTHSLDSD